MQLPKRVLFFSNWKLQALIFNQYFLIFAHQDVGQFSQSLFSLEVLLFYIFLIFNYISA